MASDFDRLRHRLEETLEAIEMADKRLEAALMGDTVCRGYVDAAKSYLQPFVGLKE